ncbi:hypothetical protein V8F33_001692 [Rhypophila sp. PSN 637]
MTDILTDLSGIIKKKPDHLERTVDEPRERTLHQVVIREIDQINSTIRLFRLEIPDPNGIEFLPGQWLDVYVPGVPQAGGFTITSPPSRAVDPSFSQSLTKHDESSSAQHNHEKIEAQQMPAFRYLELAIQESPLNPPAAWLWLPQDKILNKTIQVRVGGSFIFPPFPPNSFKPLDKVIFIAGGVGVNPLMSMLSSIAEMDFPLLQVHFLYSVRRDSPSPQKEILFLDRIAGLFGYGEKNCAGCYDGKKGKVTGQFNLFLTQPPLPHHQRTPSPRRHDYPTYYRRISKQDVASALGPDKDTSAVYICGPPSMTDSFVELLTSSEEPGGFGMEKDRVLFEKWW